MIEKYPTSNLAVTQVNTVVLIFRGLFYEAGFSSYQGKFEQTLYWEGGVIKMDWFLAVFIAIVTYATRLTCSGAAFILG